MPSEKSNPPSMGDLFLQRRRAASAVAAAAATTPLTPLSSGSGGGAATAGSHHDSGASSSGRKKSFLEIQREQQEQQLQREAPSASSGASQLRQPQRTLYNPNSNRRERISDRGAAASNSSAQQRSKLPVEQGVVHTLLDKFGFILCADRNCELFFHYSEYRDAKAKVDELNVGDEVEFRVGSHNSNGDKLAALDVRQIPKGTIFWEKEDQPGEFFRGIVEMCCMREDSHASSGSNSAARRGAGAGNSSKRGGGGDGVIRLVLTENKDNHNADESGSGGGSMFNDDLRKLDIYYTSSDYQPNNKLNNNNYYHARLERKDVIQFSLVTERRTGKKYARNITLVQSERERQRLEREAKLLENASLERGTVVSSKGDFGFLRSVSRVEQIYYHVSHIVEQQQPAGDDKEGDNTASSSLKRMSLSSLSLVEGQEVEFYVVNDVASSSVDGSGGEGGGRRGGGKKGNFGGGKSLSARKIKILPKGTVEFEHRLAQGVTGFVLECPVEVSAVPLFGAGGGGTSSSFSKKSERGGGSNRTSSAITGKIRLDIPIVNKEGYEITEVALHPDMYPCGTFAISRTGGEVGIWIRPGDALLFDVVQNIADGTYRAVPTTYTQCLSLRSDNKEPTMSNDDDHHTTNNKALVRLVKPSLCGRTEGVIRSIRDNYGFIHCAERNVDVYFPLFEVLPNEIHADVVRNNPDIYKGNDYAVLSKAGRIHVEIGMEVSFDLSLQVSTNSGIGGRGGAVGGGRSRQNNVGGGGGAAAAQEKESLRGRRVQILPKGTVQEKILIASQVKATVTKEDPKPFVGTIELEEALVVQSAALRHPLASKLLDFISEGRYGDEITFHDVLSEKDIQVVTSMVKNRDDLEWLYVPVSGEDTDDPYNRRLRIVRKVKSDDSAKLVENAEDGSAEETESAKGEIVADAAADVAAKTDSTDDYEKPFVDKKKGKKEKVLKTIRYDKCSFHDISGGPLGVSDTVSCDIFLSRRSGSFLVENMVAVERKGGPLIHSAGEDDKKTSSNSTRKDLKGFVTEVVPSRLFGFITAVDEEGCKTGDHIFFHFKNVGSDDEAKLATRSDVIRKGDEVKFDAGHGKNGKQCGTNITILPRGTLKIPAAKIDKATTCTGYILMEPSHTSLANTPSHIVYKSSGSTIEGGVGRWDNVKEARSSGDSNKSGSSVIEEGIILLLSDPSHLFSPHPNRPKPSGKNGEETESVDVDMGSEDKETKIVCETSGIKDETNNQEKDDDDRNECSEETPASDVAVCVGVRVRYKSSSIAFRNLTGVGSLVGPKRGDLVVFGKTRGANLVKDIRVEKAGAATSIVGTLEDINTETDTAVFVRSENEQRYEINLSEVVSCHKSLLRNKEKVDGILHEGHIYGVCRTKDIHLASTFNRDRSGSSCGLKERPKLNLTVKKELQGMGGQIMAQSSMARGPDGTNGFAPGWTTRVSLFEQNKDSSNALNAQAPEFTFVPSNELINASGFESTQ